MNSKINGFALAKAVYINTPHLTATEKWVLTGLAHHANSSAVCHPAQGTLARNLGLSIRTVNKIINTLSHKGYLTKYGHGAGGTLKYQINTTILERTPNVYSSVNTHKTYEYGAHPNERGSYPLKSEVQISPKKEVHIEQKIIEQTNLNHNDGHTPANGEIADPDIQDYVRIGVQTALHAAEKEAAKYGVPLSPSLSEFIEGAVEDAKNGILSTICTPGWTKTPWNAITGKDVDSARDYIIGAINNRTLRSVREWLGVETT